MITREEIERVARLMRIEITDGAEYTDKVQAMVGYFDILDSAGVEDEEIPGQETRLSDLRPDEHVPYGGSGTGDEKGLIHKLKHCNDTNYVRAPDMR